MSRRARPLSLKVSIFLNQSFNCCWLVPVAVALNERVIRAIYSPYHIDKKNKLKHQAYDPTPGTDEVSGMRLEYMGAPLCKRRAQSFENATKGKLYRGLAVLQAHTLRSHGMQIIDSRKYFCGHADVKLMLDELVNREGDEPLSPETGKKLKDLKAALLSNSVFVSDSQPSLADRHNREFFEKIDDSHSGDG